MIYIHQITRKIYEIDDDWDKWQAGDQIIWEENKNAFLYGKIQPFTLLEVDEYGRVFWHDPEAEEKYHLTICMTRGSNMLRVQEEK